MIIGSTALLHHFPDLGREPSDLDVLANVMVTIDELITIEKSKVKVEYLENPVLVNYMHSMGWFSKEYIPKNVLYTLKCSHSFWALKNRSWRKHMWDIQFMKEKGCELIEPLFWGLYYHWVSVHGQHKKSNLDMSAEEFFDNALDFPADHDTMHEWLIEHPYFEGQTKPTYTYILKDGAEVDVCETKFNRLTEKQKFNVVFEEVANMAMERFNQLYYKHAYEIMLQKFITDHAYPWEGIWIIENHKKLMCNIPFDFIEFFKIKLRHNNDS